MPAQAPDLGMLMNPMLPQPRNPPSPSATMVSPSAPPQPRGPMPPGGMPPPAGGMVPGAMPAPPPQMPPPAMQPPAPPPMLGGPSSAIMPQQMPDIVSLIMQQLMAGGEPGMGQGLQPGAPPIPGVR